MDADDDEAGRRLRELDDPALPALRSLLGPEAGSLLAAAVPPTAGEDDVQLTRISWRPGRSLVAVYRRRVASDPADETVLVARTDRAPGATTATVSVWERPDDPGLPGLRATLQGPDLGSWLDGMGVDDGTIGRRVVSYRPGHRAVIDVRRGGSRTFVKVVRPSAVADLRRRHDALAGLVPVPRIMGHASATGIVVMQALEGETAVQSLVGGRVLDPALVLGLHDRIHRATGIGPRVVASPLERVGEHVRSIGRLLPEEATDLAELAAAIGPEHRKADATIHADLHLGQILLRGDAVAGLLDLDTVGTGRAADDPANMLAHLTTLALPVAGRADPDWRAPAAASIAALIRAASTVHDADDLHRRTAAALIGLAAAQFQGQRPEWPDAIRLRLQAARLWLDRPTDIAATIAGMSTLRASSSAPHGHLTDDREYRTRRPGAHPITVASIHR